MKLITKSRFLAYQMCPKDAWFRIHKPELEEFEISTTVQGIMDQGVEVEEYSKKLKLFSGFIEVKSRGFSEFKKEVDDLMKNKTPVIYQPSFAIDGYMIRCDFIVYNLKTNKWDLYEVKGTNSKKENKEPRDHISDLAFQTIVLEHYGVDVGDSYIVHLNKEYIRDEELDVEQLFIVSISTDQVEEVKDDIAREMEKAKIYLNQETEPKDGCDCHFCGRSSHCDTFSISHPEVPEYSVHDLSRIGLSKGKLQHLVENGIYHIHDIEDISDFSDTQQNQIITHKTDKEIINKEGIAEIIDGYTYPLYFFDYETFAPAVPIYAGFKTYQRIPIQLSLHIIDKKGGPVRHVEYLQKENKDPSVDVAKLLNETILPGGTILAWNVSFERSVTREIAERLPEYEIILDRICGQMKDLRDIFSEQHYVHKDFRGSSSIEAVMEVLLPEMTYDHLPYTGADVGVVWWNDIVNEGPEPKDRENKMHLILEYCKQDTFVMVEIFRILNEVINKK